jgi:hypothetical protein
MPQFDTFAFLTQLVWVLLFFSLLYFSLIYFIIPSIATILKVRKRKLQSIGTTTGNNLTTTGSSLALVSNQLSQESISIDSSYLTASNDVASISTASNLYVLRLKHIILLSKLTLESHLSS